MLRLQGTVGDGLSVHSCRNAPNFTDRTARRNLRSRLGLVTLGFSVWRGRRQGDFVILRQGLEISGKIFVAGLAKPLHSTRATTPPPGQWRPSDTAASPQRRPSLMAVTCVARSGVVRGGLVVVVMLLCCFVALLRGGVLYCYAVGLSVVALLRSGVERVEL